MKKSKPSAKSTGKSYGPKTGSKSGGKFGGKAAGKSVGKTVVKSVAASAGKTSSKKSDTKTSPKKKFKSGGGTKPRGKGRRFEENLDIQYTDKELGEISVIKRKLAEIREYKKILAEDGLKPDQDDKARESELIVRLLRIEKNAKLLARQKAKAAKTEAFREAAEKAAFAREKKKSREDRFSDDNNDDDY